MEEVIRVAPSDTPYLTDVVVYIITRSGQYLNASQAQFLIGRGDVKLNGEVVRSVSRVVDLGINVLEVRGRSYPIDVIGKVLETA